MPYCLVPGCRPSTARHVSYHSLPRDEALAKCWLEACGHLDLQNSKSAKYAKICSAHFTKSDYKNHLQYTLMASGNSAARPRLKEDAVPTLVTQGWKKIRTVPREIRPAVKRDPQKEEKRNEYVSQALHEYETGQLSGDPVQTIRSQLKMRRARRPRVQLVQVDQKPNGQILIGNTLHQPAPASRQGASRDAAPLRVFASRGITEQLAAERGDELDAEALRLLQNGTTTSVTWDSHKTPQSSAGLGQNAQNDLEIASTRPYAAVNGEASRLPSEMPGRFREVLGRQRKICSLQLTLRRQTEQLQALQARHELELEELDVTSDSVGQLFPPLDVASAEMSASAGGDMLLTPATLEEATAELKKLRTEVLELRMKLLECAVAANDRALMANTQRANLLTVFTPRQADILVGRRTRSDAWDTEDLRRAISLRRVLTRRQYEHLRLHFRLPLPALRQTAVAAQTEHEKRRLYRRLLDQRRSETDGQILPIEQTDDDGGAAPLQRHGELLVLRGTTAGGKIQLGRWDGLKTGTGSERMQQTEQHLDYEHHRSELVCEAEEMYEAESVYEVEPGGELVEGEIVEDGEVVDEVEVDSLHLPGLLLDGTVTDEVEIGWEEKRLVNASRSRPMKVAVTPSHRQPHHQLEPRETLMWDDIM